MNKQYEWPQPSGEVWLVETTKDSIVVREKETFKLISEKKPLSELTIRLIEDNFFATVATEINNDKKHEDDWLRMRYI